MHDFAAVVDEFDDETIELRSFFRGQLRHRVPASFGDGIKIALARSADRFEFDARVRIAHTCPQQRSRCNHALACDTRDAAQRRANIVLCKSHAQRYGPICSMASKAAGMAS